MAETLKKAIHNGNIEEVSYLIDAGININKDFDDGTTPLNYAISIHEEEIAKLLLKKGAMVHQSDSFRVDECRRCPIHYAASCNLLDMLCHLITRGASINELDYGHSTPLHHAAFSGNVEIVEHLLNIGADLNHQSKSGRTAIWKACQNGQDEVVHYLLESGADINIQNKVGATMLFDAVRQDKTDLLGELINFGANLNLKDIEENTVLHCASCLGKTEAVEMLLLPGTLDVNAGNEYGNTALHNSTMHDHLDTSICLLNNGADFSLLNRNGQSCLYLTMLHRQVACTILLHDSGARLTPREMRMYRDFEARKYESTEMFYIWAFDYFCTPKRLANLCVATIRNNMNHPVEYFKNKLDLPKALRESLTLRDYKNLAVEQ